jgi:hypothetical protein
MANLVDFDRYATGIATIDLGKRRFTLLEEVRRSAKWNQPRTGQDEQIVAEFIALGHIRLHKIEDIAPSITAEEERIQHRIKDIGERELAHQILRDTGIAFSCATKPS